MDYTVFDTDNKSYTIKDVEKLMNDNIKEKG